MRVVVAGGTGFIGRGLTAHLRAKGHEVVVLSRRAGPGAVVWDPRSSGPWEETLEGAGAVVNLAGASIAGRRWSPEYKAALVSSRLDSTTALVAAISRAKKRPAAFLSGSAIGYYGDTGDADVSESSRAGGDFLARLCVDWERAALAAESLGLRVALLRTGHVLHKEGGMLGKMLPPFKLGLGGPLGSGKQWVSWIHRDDWCAVVERLLTAPVSGPVNLTAPEPARNGDFSRALGAALHRPALLPAPAFALKLVFGEFADALLSGQKVLPKKALEAGWGFEYPSLDAALRAAVR